MAEAWRWQRVNDRVGRDVLVDVDGAPVLCVGRTNKLLTRDNVTSALITLDPDGPIARMMAAAPKMHGVCLRAQEIGVALRRTIRSGDTLATDALIDELIYEAMRAQVAAEPLPPLTEAAHG